MGFKITLCAKEETKSDELKEYDLSDLIDGEVSEFVLPNTGNYNSTVIVAYNGLIQRRNKFTITDGILKLNFIPTVDDDLIIFYQGE